MASRLPEIPKSATDVEALTQLAVDRYDFDSVRNDIAAIIDIPSAIGRIGTWAFGLPLTVSVLTWLLFRSRMGSGALLLFLIAVAVLAAIAGVAIGVALVTRRRVDKTSAAAARIVEITGMVHGDYEQVREGAARVSVRSVGVLAAREIVLPALFGVAGRAALLTGPLGWLARPLLGIIENKVSRALGELPDTPRALAAGSSPARVTDTVADRISDTDVEILQSDATAAMAEATAADSDVGGLASVGDAYADIQQRFEQIVGRIGGVAIATSTLVAVAASLPVLIVLALGWLAS